MTIDPYGLTDVVTAATGDGVSDSPFENRLLAFMEGNSGALIAIAQQLSEDSERRQEHAERIMSALERIAEALEDKAAWNVKIEP